jgi:hypothetical protein
VVTTTNVPLAVIFYELFKVVNRRLALLDAARLGPSREPFQVLQDPAVQDNPLVEDDETTFDEPPPELDPAMPDGIAEDDTGRIQPLP